MKAEELMIGDWGNIYVFSNENPKGKDLFPAKITSIFTPTASESSGDTIECMFTALDGTGGVGYASRPIETFLPIPLTAEILEQNGFEEKTESNPFVYYLFKDGDNSVSLEHTYDITDKEDYWACSIGNRLCDVCTISMHYIHELQHALRLCGITREIVL